MDALKTLLDIAGRLNAPGLVTTGFQIAAAVRDYAGEVKATADRVPHVLKDAERAELDVIHASALAAADELDAKLAAVEQTTSHRAK